MSNLFFYIDNFERYSFFLNLAVAAKKTGRKVYCVTNRPSVYFRSKASFDQSFLLSRKGGVSANIDLSKTVSVVSGRISRYRAYELYSSMCDFLKNNLSKDSLIVIWNGSCPIGSAIRELKEELKYKTLYMEISNLPSGLVVDPCGVNANSSLYHRRDEIKKYKSTRSVDDSWVSIYKEYKRNPPPQVGFQKKINLSAAVDFLAYLVMPRLISDDQRGALAYLKRKIAVGKGGSYGNIIESPSLSASYLFAPLQLTSDSQVLLNSDYDNFDLIRMAHAEAIRKEYVLYVKLHPAEDSMGFIKEVFAYVENHEDIFLVGGNTTDLIENSMEVFVINSTIGLESMILKKPVTVIGRAFFSWFDSADVSSYIFSYLIPVDYFSCSSVDEDIFYSILERSA